MKEHFAGFYSIGDKEAKTIIASSIIVLDAESLFSLFRIEDTFQLQILNILESIENSLWMPYDVAWMYHKHINDVIQHQLQDTDSFLVNLNKCDLALKELNCFPHLSTDTAQRLSDIINEVKSYRDNLLTEVRKLIRGGGAKEKLAEIYKKKVGPGLGQGYLDNIAKEAESRIKSNLPPYCHSNESPLIQERYHNVIVWEQMIKHAKEINKDILYVTSCINDNWFHVVNSEAISTRNELIGEFHTKTSHNFYCLELEVFLREYFAAHPYERKEELLRAVKSRIEYNSISVDINKEDQTNG
jgi:hypothetical protein